MQGSSTINIHGPTTSLGDIGEWSFIKYFLTIEKSIPNLVPLFA